MFARTAMSLLTAFGSAIGSYLASLMVSLPFVFSIAVLESIGQLIVVAMVVVLFALFWFLTGHVLDIESNWRRALLVTGMAVPWLWFAFRALTGHSVDIEPLGLRLTVEAISLLGYVIFGIVCGIRYWQTHSPAGEGPVTWRIRAPTDASDREMRTANSALLNSHADSQGY